MRRKAHAASAAAILSAVCGLGAGDPCGPRPRRESPPNAFQPPGATFEKDVTGAQKRLLARDLVRDTLRQAVRHPFRSAVNQTGRWFERMGTFAVEAVPRLPAPPFHQSPDAGGPLTPAKITPFYDSRPAFQALLDAVASARYRVDLMMYSWDDDVAGRAAASALIARARAGVLVRVMVDKGSFVTGEDNKHVPLGARTFLDDLRAEPNVRLIETPDAFARFDHRKLAVIDDRLAWTGGMILTRPALFRWHNFAFYAEGPIVAQYAALFRERWEQLGGCHEPPCPAEGSPAVEPNATVRMVRTDVHQRTLKEAVYGAVDSARHHIYLENCYFSDAILVKKLNAASRRGVKVSAVLTMRGDVHAFNKYTPVMANRLFRQGADVYLYPAMTHVKALSVDGTFLYIGTGNFDELSLRNNREVSLTVRGPDLLRRVDENLFLRDMAASQKLRAPLPTPKGRLSLEALSVWF